MSTPAVARTAIASSRAWLHGRFVERLDAVVADVCADRNPATRVLALGVDQAVLERLRDRFGPALSTERAAASDVDLIVAVGVLAASADPVAELRGLQALSSRHLVLAEPRTPFARDARSWTLPGLQRLVSQVCSVRAVSTAPRWLLVWAVMA